jgi:hypothetical protein
MESNSDLPISDAPLDVVIRVHLDTEFTNFIDTDPISIGLAADSGHEFYGENADFCEKNSSSWVRANVYPLLTPERSRMKESELSARIWCWLDDLPCTKVRITTDYPADWQIFSSILEDPHPKIEGADDIWALMKTFAKANTFKLGQGDYEYHKFYSALTSAFTRGFLDYFKATGEIPHHALSDAKANRAGYLRLVTEFGMPA